MKRVEIKCTISFDKFDYNELTKDEKNELYYEYNDEEIENGEVTENDIFESPLIKIRDLNGDEGDIFISGIYKDDESVEKIMDDINRELNECLFDNIIE